MAGNYIQCGHFEASGANVALVFPNMNRNPDCLMMWNEVKFATDATNVMLFWQKDYAAGDGSIIVNDTTDGMEGVRETTNGATQNDSVSCSETASQVSCSHTLNVTLGSAFRGADSDEIFYVALWSDNYVDHGDINA